MAAYKPKSWVQKRQSGKSSKIERLEKPFADIPAGGTMLVATPEVVDNYIRQIPPGITTDILQMRKDLAVRFGADYTCPLTAGIFVRIAAEAAWEELQQGKSIKDITPFWRIIKDKSPTRKKLSWWEEFSRIRDALKLQ